MPDMPQEFPHRISNLKPLRLQRKMSRIHKRDLRILQIPLESPGTRWDERRIPFPPDCQQRDLALSEVLVERRIQIDIGPVIVQQVQLYLLLLRRLNILQVVVRLSGGINAR